MTIKGYFTLFVVVLILLLCCAVLWLWKEKDNAQSALIAANTLHTADVATHKDDQKTIASLIEYREANGKVMAIFVSKISEIEGKYSSLQGDISKLRRANPDVEKYLSTPIPPALLCFLGGVCPQSTAPVAPN